MLQLVRHLRRQGYFVAATLTRPFEFEGARRLEAADALISTMEEVAHLVVSGVRLTHAAG
jgi:cell division GTPase FtsZ